MAGRSKEFYYDGEYTFEYKDVTITYFEKTNKWVMELGGREQKSDSLATAKQKIDKYNKELKRTKRTEFEPFTAYYIDSDYFDAEGIEEVFVTSIALDERRYGYTHRDDKREVYVWANRNGGRRNLDGERGKIAVSHLRDFSKANDKIIEQIREVQKQERILHKKRTDLGKKLRNKEVLTELDLVSPFVEIDEKEEEDSDDE